MSEQVKTGGINNPRFSLYGKKDQNSSKVPTLKPGYYGNNPQFSLFNANEGNLYFTLDITSFSEFMEAVRECANSNGRHQMRWNVRGYDSSTKKQKLIGTLICGRSEDGCVYIAVVGDGWNKPYKFEFTPSYKFELVDQEGNRINGYQHSAIMARGWANALEQTMLMHHNDNFTSQPRGSGKGNYNKGGYNNNNSNNNYSGGGSNNSGGGSNNSGGGGFSSYDDEMIDLL